MLASLFLFASPFPFSTNPFAFKLFYSPFTRKIPLNETLLSSLVVNLVKLALAENRDISIGVEKLVTRLHIHTPHHSSHTGVVSSVHMNSFPTCTCTIFLCFLSFCFLPFHQSLPIHRPPPLQHDLLVTQVTEGWFERVFICSPPGRAGVWHCLGDECHPRK